MGRSKVKEPLVIGDLVVEKPIIQGGMGVGISLSSLAGTVAKEGGMGIISTAQIGFKDPDFQSHQLEANLRAIGSELCKAREIGPNGAVGFNIMVATKKDFATANRKKFCSRIATGDFDAVIIRTFTI